MTVDEVDKTKKEVVKLLKTIKTVDDLKENKEDVLAGMESLYKAALAVLKNFFETALSMGNEEKEQEIARFQDDNFLFDQDIEQEMTRIDSMPGADEFFDEFGTEMERRIAPYMEEISKEMALHMGELLGGMMEGMMEGIGEIFGDMEDSAGEENEEKDEGFGEDYEDDDSRNPDLEWIYNIDTLEKFKEEKDGIIDHIEGILQSDIDNINYMNKEMPDHGGIWDNMSNAEYRQRTYVKEMNVEFDRIAAMPDGSEFAEAFRKEFTDRVTPVSEKLTKLITETKARLREKESQQQ